MAKPSPRPELPRRFFRRRSLVNRRLEQAIAWTLRASLERHPWPTGLAVTLAYVCGMLGLPGILHESVNFFVVLPVIIAGLLGGLPGGMVAGALGLPCNLLLLALAGHPDAAPRSWWMAELSGISLGTIIGYLSEYLYRVERAIVRRRQVIRLLAESLRQRQALVDELDHRVRNNLNLILSLIRLSARRRAQDAPGLALDLERRILALAQAHELVEFKSGASHVDLGSYLRRLVQTVGEKLGAPGDLGQCVQTLGDPVLLDPGRASAVGMMVGELVCNAWQHGRRPDQALRLAVALEGSPDKARLSVSDGGPGFDPDPATAGLGLRLVEIQAQQLGAVQTWERREGMIWQAEFPLAPP